MDQTPTLLDKMLNKVFSLYVIMRFRGVPKPMRYFYRDTYMCQFKQAKYVVKDFISRKPYKTVSFSGEFAPEIMYVLPFAYWHYKNGTLKETRSSRDTRELYYFSPLHSEPFEKRTNEGNYNFETPRILYSHDYNMTKWELVPLKAVYKNDIYVYEKPILIIANRYNSEWDGPPISFFSIEMLDYLISMLKDDYTIIYNRPGAGQITIDHSEIYDLKEHGWLRKEHPEVILMDDLWKENRAHANNFNHFQLVVYANADRFISTHGGTASLASYFGGINLIYSLQGGEHHFNCFQTIFPMLSDAKILHAKTDEEFKNYVEEYFVKSIK